MHAQPADEDVAHGPGRLARRPAAGEFVAERAQSAVRKGPAAVRQQVGGAQQPPDGRRGRRG
ncbi:hypothetical protein [Streptomyces thioluteus]|uniref:hypothetical protein n=1 Tax=Streptomyces thioluteus TaxID=66431 RepID=UPI0031EB9C3C